MSGTWNASSASSAFSLWTEVSEELYDRLEPIHSRSVLQNNSSSIPPVTSNAIDRANSRNLSCDESSSDDHLLTHLVTGQQSQENLNVTAFEADLELMNAQTGEVVSFQKGIITTSPPTRSSSWLSISSNQTLNETLSTTDLSNPNRLGSYFDGYLLSGVSVGQVVQVNLNSTTFDTYVQLVNADTGEVLASNDDINYGTILNSRLSFTVETGVNYLIRATSFSAGAIGDYSITTQTLTLPAGYNTHYGYGLVNASAAVANALGQASPFADVTNLGGNDWGRDMINAPEVWAQGYTGQGIVVAVIDTGVDYHHSDLDGNIWVNSDEIAGNGIDDDGNSYIDDVRGWDFVDNDSDPMDTDNHGTHVAGIIAAENNGTGITGVAYNAQIMPVRVLGPNGGLQTDISAGIRYAVDNGANVINLSLAGNYTSEIESAAIQYAAENGVVVVMAASNDGDPQPDYPGYYATDWGIAVGAVDNTNTMADFSNQAGTTPLDYVVAPGVDILSTIRDDFYQAFNGTSMAAPHVAGVAALILNANSSLTPTQVEDIITATANPLGITV